MIYYYISLYNLNNSYICIHSFSSIEDRDDNGDDDQRMQSLYYFLIANGHMFLTCLACVFFRYASSPC